MILVRKHIYRRHYLTSLFSGENVGVFLRNGEVRYKPFLGYAQYDHVVAVKMATPVRLDVEGYYESGVGDEYIRFKDGEFVQGCLTPAGVYAVLQDDTFRVVTKP